MKQQIKDRAAAQFGRLDGNADGKINREEYVSWATSVAAHEFDDMAGGSASVTADKVFENFLRYQETAGQG